MLVSRATGGVADEHAYRSLRTDLIRNPKTKDNIPKFVRTCRTLDEFWGFMQPKFAHYQERRIFIREKFDPLLTRLEQESSTPSDNVVTEILTTVDSAHIRDAWEKALERRESDPEGAITIARTLLESVFKHILDELEVDYTNKEDLPKLYGIVAKKLNLAPNQHTEAVFKQILGGCHSIVQGLGALRSRLGDAHGKGSKEVKPASRHAEFAVNVAGSMATFLLATLEVRRD